jgi:hypothetical protein
MILMGIIEETRRCASLRKGTSLLKVVKPNETHLHYLLDKRTGWEYSSSFHNLGNLLARCSLYLREFIRYFTKPWLTRHSSIEPHTLLLFLNHIHQSNAMQREHLTMRFVPTPYLRNHFMYLRLRINQQYPIRKTRNCRTRKSASTERCHP